MKAINMTLDEALRPLEMTCIKCKGKLTDYPCPIPEGTGYCSNCSPKWLESFATFLMNEERVSRGLARI